jgi:mannose-6-phosphate isomerase-like protein (cupin superfamily)
MIIKNPDECNQFTAGDGSLLRELLNPLKETIRVNYSLAHAVLPPGEATLDHRLKSAEVYYIIEGAGEMFVDDERAEVSAGQAVYIPPGAVQRLRNTGQGDLVFLCIVDPAWRPEDEVLVQRPGT